VTRNHKQTGGIVMKIYEVPQINIFKFEIEDIVRTSLGDDDFSGENWVN